MLDILKEQFDNIVVFDTETTGVDFRKDEIIEIGIMRVAVLDGELVVQERDDLLIRLTSGKKVPDFIKELTGIDDAMLEHDGVSKETACSVVERYFRHERTLLVAYNAQFDLCFLYYFLHRMGMAEILKGVKMLDAMTVYKDRRPFPHKLKNAIEAYQLQGENSHRAVDDAAATLELLTAMAAEEDDLHRYVNLFGYHPKYGVSGPKISSVNYVPQGDFGRKLYEKEIAPRR